MPTEFEAKEEGKRAYQQGKDFDDNPFKKQSDLYREWGKGFVEQEDATSDA